MKKERISTMLILFYFQSYIRKIEIMKKEIYVPNGRLATRLDIRKLYTKQKACKIFKQFPGWSKKKIDEQLEIIYSSSLEELEDEASRGIFLNSFN